MTEATKNSINSSLTRMWKEIDIVTSPDAQMKLVEKIYHSLRAAWFLCNSMLAALRGNCLWKNHAFSYLSNQTITPDQTPTYFSLNICGLADPLPRSTGKMSPINARMSSIFKRIYQLKPNTIAFFEVARVNSQAIAKELTKTHRNVLFDAGLNGGIPLEPGLMFATNEKIIEAKFVHFKKYGSLFTGQAFMARGYFKIITENTVYIVTHLVANNKESALRIKQLNQIETELCEKTDKKIVFMADTNIDKLKEDSEDWIALKSFIQNNEFQDPNQDNYSPTFEIDGTQEHVDYVLIKDHENSYTSEIGAAGVESDHGYIYTKTTQ